MQDGTGDEVNTYRERPAYQQNDYLGWIDHAKREETKEKRLRQMPEELEAGGVHEHGAFPFEESVKGRRR